MEQKKYSLHPALCLDFDGTIRKSKSGNKYIIDAADIELFSDVEPKLIEYRDKGYLIIGVSNQGSVAHGIKTAEQIKEEISATEKLFKEPLFNFARFCFSMEDGRVEPWCHRSLFRKPNYGVLAAAENEMLLQGIVIDWDNSIMVGDRPEDKQLAENAKIKFIHCDTFFNRK